MFADLKGTLHRWWSNFFSQTQSERKERSNEGCNEGHQFNGDSDDARGLVFPQDENLLERSRIQWQFGEWEKLTMLERASLQHHPDRAKLALLAAAGHLQQGNSQTARQFTRLAQDWGCSKKLISQILISGVHNTLGKAASANRQQSLALRHFERAITVASAGGDIKLLTQARINHQASQLPPGCSIQSAIKIERLDLVAPPVSSAFNHFHAVLAELHETLSPNFYLEIGVGRGNSLMLAKCKSIGIDPVAQERLPLGPNVQLITTSSDEFFAILADEWLAELPDLVLLDGMPLVDYVLRAIAAIESRALPHTLVAIPGIFPRVPEEATRNRTGSDWMGDIWKLPAILRAYRPDLQLLELDVEPAGLLLITALVPKDTVFADKRKEFAEIIQNTNPPQPEILQRKGAVGTDDARYSAYLQYIRAMKS